MKTTTRALLALSLLSGFYLLVLAAVVVDIGVLVGMVMSPASDARMLGVPTGAMTPIAASAPLLVAIFYGVFTVSRPNDRIIGSVLLPRDKAAELWEMVEELADLVGTRPPTEIRLIGEANALVSEESYLLGLFPGRARVLYVGAPLLVGLRADELRAVLSHELGHYARKHTRLAAIVYRGSAALRTMMEQLHEVAGGGRRRYFFGYSLIMYLMLSRYGKLYHRIAFAVTRRQELEADAAAARIVGPEVIAEALRAVHAISVSWEKFDSQILTPMRRSGRLPDDPFSAYQSMLDDPHYRDEFARLRYEIPQEASKPLDSHPSLATRLHTLGGLPDEVVDLDFRPAIDLYPEYQTSFERVRAGLYRSNPKPLPWRDWLAMAAEARALERARALKRAEARLGPSTQARQSLLAAVLNLLESGQALPLARSLDAESDDDEAESSARLLTALLSLVGQGLVQINAATWHLSWTGDSTLVPRDITAEELIDLIAAAIRDPLEVPRLRLHLASLGLAEDAQIALGRQSAKPGLLNVNPLIDEREKQRRKGMATAAIVTMFGLLFALMIVANTPLAKREQASNQFSPDALQSQITYNNDQSGQNLYSPPAYPYSTLLAAPRITLPTVIPSYLYHPLPPLNLLIPTAGVSTIVVHSGDSLSAIAQRCHTTVADLQSANDMGSSTLIDAGQTLKIPSIGIILPAACGD